MLFNFDKRKHRSPGPGDQQPCYYGLWSLEGKLDAISLSDSIQKLFFKSITSCNMQLRGHCFCFSQCISYVTPEIVYFHYLRKNIIWFSIQKICYSILKKEAPMAVVSEIITLLLRLVKSGRQTRCDFAVGQYSKAVCQEYHFVQRATVMATVFVLADASDRSPWKIVIFMIWK